MDIFLMALAITFCIFCLMVDRPLLRLSLFIQLEINYYTIKLQEFKLKRQRAEYIRKIENARNPIQVMVYKTIIIKIDKTLNEIKEVLSR